METRTGFPFRGKYLEELRAFLAANGLKYDDRITYSLCLVEDGTIAAAGSLDGSVLKCIAVSKDFQDEGLAARIVSGLASEAARNGVFHLFLFTKPENASLFGSLGFYRISQTAGALLMENKKNGISAFAASLREQAGSMTANKSAGDTGALVMNCNPFTKGHQYLIETAAAQCGLLYVFVVSEDKSAFPAADRFDLVRKGTAHIPNAAVLPTGPYLISHATFPDYFFKDSVDPQSVNALLDVTIFAEHFARPLGIDIRFAGTEPLDPVTDLYNRVMREYLPKYGIEFVEVERLERGGKAVSAGRVRELLAEGKMEEIRELVPPATYTYLYERQKTGRTA
jgi:[citrate (pro-3S)-lyase] ligase